MKNNWLKLVVIAFLFFLILYMLIFKLVWDSDMPLWLKIALTNS